MIINPINTTHTLRVIPRFNLLAFSSTDILDTGVISNLGGGSFVFTDDGILGVSDGTSGSFLRPRLQWDSLTVGEQYRIVGTPTINSGSTNYSFKNGSTYLKNKVAVEAFDITFTCDGAVFFAADGREVFDINWDLKLYEGSKIDSGLVLNIKDTTTDLDEDIPIASFTTPTLSSIEFDFDFAATDETRYQITIKEGDNVVYRGIAIATSQDTQEYQLTNDKYYF